MPLCSGVPLNRASVIPWERCWRQANEPCQTVLACARPALLFLVFPLLGGCQKWPVGISLDFFRSSFQTQLSLSCSGAETLCQPGRSSLGTHESSRLNPVFYIKACMIFENLHPSSTLEFCLVCLRFVQECRSVIPVF